MSIILSQPGLAVCPTHGIMLLAKGELWPAYCGYCTAPLRRATGVERWNWEQEQTDDFDQRLAEYDCYVLKDMGVLAT